jgi:hypothetical protein
MVHQIDVHIARDVFTNATTLLSILSADDREELKSSRANNNEVFFFAGLRYQLLNRFVVSMFRCCFLEAVVDST